MQYLLAFLFIIGLAHGQGSIKDEFTNKKPWPLREIVYLRLTPPSDPELIERLVRVEDNFKHALDPYGDNPKLGERSVDVFWQNYAEIYQDKKDSTYYAGIFRRVYEDETKGLKKVNWGRHIHKTNWQRIVIISNLSPSLSLIADAADWGELYVRQIVPTYDFYKGYSSGRGYLYNDPENKTPLKMLPITNKATGAVAYKGFPPRSGRPFYALRRYGHYEDEIYPGSPAFPRWVNYEEINPYALGVSGTLEGFSDTPKEVWEWRAHNNYRLFVE